MYSENILLVVMETLHENNILVNTVICNYKAEFNNDFLLNSVVGKY